MKNFEDTFYGLTETLKLPSQQPTDQHPFVAPRTNLERLLVEPRSPCERREKKLFLFDQSLARLRAQGYARHARPAEAFGILASSLDGNRKRTYRSLAKNMLKSYGEWLSIALFREGGIVTVALDPENFVWNGMDYELHGTELQHQGIWKFSIGSLPSERWVDLREFPLAFVQLMYGRKFKDLPHVFQDGDERARVWLPPEGVWRPVARGSFDDYQSVDALCNYGASRGVLEH